MESNYFNPQKPQENLPNATAVLVLGIVSIVLVCCCGVLGLAAGIIAVVMGAQSRHAYSLKQDAYTLKSYNQMNAGFICGIVGIVLNCISMLISLIMYVNDPHYMEKIFRGFK